MTASELQFFTLTSAAEIEAIAHQWDELLQRSNCNRTFSSLTWNLEAARLPAAGSPFVIAGWRAGRLAAIFPLSLVSEAGASQASDAAALCPIADYNDIVCESGDWAAAAQCLAFALTHPKPYLRLNLRRTAAQSNCIRAIREMGHQADAWYRSEGAWSFTDLPETFDEFLRSKSRNFRSHLHRAERAAREDGASVRELEADQLSPGELPELLIRLNRCRLGDKSVFDRDPRIGAFVRGAFPRLFQEGRLRVFVIQAGGQIEAIDVAAVGTNSLCTWNGGFSDRAAAWSPGWLLSAAGIRRAIELGYREYDLLRGSQEWKTRLATRTRDVGRLTIPVGAFSSQHCEEDVAEYDRAQSAS
jgi:CelD/BcsL family acetyltransferase involved in cellulose biosynthesis